MALSKEAIKKLRAVKAAILAEPHLYEQDSIAERRSCGTACCIAGWVVRLDVSAQKFHALLRSRSYSIIDLATSKLGLSASQAGRLFSEAGTASSFGKCDWPAAYKREYEDAGDVFIRAEVGAERIEHFIRTGGAE